MIGFQLSTGEVISVGEKQKVEFELASCLFDEDIPGGNSVNMTVPDTEQNYRKLGFVNRMDKLGRVIEFDSVGMILNGRQEYTGKLFVKRAKAKGIECFYVPNGFAAEILGKMLRDVNYGGILNLGADTAAVVTAASGYVTQDYPSVNFNFPSIYSPQFYDTEDAIAWHGPHNTDRWENRDYEINEYVSVVDGNITVASVYRCVVAAASNEPPILFPAKWVKQDGMALLNNWDDTAGEFRKNDLTDISTFNKYALSPQLYTKFILESVGNTYGYKIVGEFVDDVQTDQLITHNNVAIDKGEVEFYVRASQDGIGSPTTACNHYAAGGYHTIAHGVNNGAFTFNDETTAPNQDADGIYDGCDTSDYTIQTAGRHVFRIEITISGNNMSLNPTLNLYMWDNTTYINSGDVLRYLPAGYTGLAQYEFEYDVPPGEVGYTVQWRLGNTFPGEYIVIDAGSFVQYENSHANNMNKYNGDVTLADHVPDVTISDFLIGLKRRFNLNVIIEPNKRTIRMDYAINLLEEEPTDYTDVIDSPTFEYKTANGITVSEDFNSEVEVQDGEGVTVTAEVASIIDLVNGTYLYDIGTVVRDLSSNTLWKLGVNTSVSRRWKPLGNYYPNHIYGDGKASLEMIGQPANMEMMAFEDDYIVVPRMDVKGSSILFGMGRRDCPLMFSFWHGMQDSYNGDFQYPMASAHPYDVQGSLAGSVDLRFQSYSGKSVWSTKHEEWHRKVNGTFSLIGNAFMSPKDVFEWTFRNPFRIRYNTFIRKSLVYSIDQYQQIKAQIQGVKIEA